LFTLINYYRQVNKRINIFNPRFLKLQRDNPLKRSQQVIKIPFFHGDFFDDLSIPFIAFVVDVQQLALKAGCAF
jgi:hypothetical protein